MKKYILIFFLLFSGISYAQNDSISALNKVINLGLKPNAKMPWKNPGITAVHTMIMPGTGYLANDKIALGFTTLLLEPALLAGGVFSIAYLDIYGLGFTAIGLAGAIHIVQLAHSVILTHRSNKINGYVLEYSEKQKRTELTLGMTGNGVGLNLQF